MKKNKFLLGSVLGLFVFVGIATAANFSDIAGHWAEDNLTWAVNNGLLKGDDTKTLHPNDVITRAEMVTILKRYDELRKSAQNNNSTNESADSFATTVGGITWIGRKSLDSEEKTVYQVVKIDALGNGSILYERPFNPYGDVEWNFSEDGKHLVIKGRSGGPEGGLYTTIGLIDGEEKIRSQYDQYGSFQKNLTFKLPGSPTTFNVTLATSPTSKACEGDESEIAVPKTTLTGVKISSEETSKLFELPEPITVDCALIDGGFLDHHPQNIITDVDGISFSLPNGDRASLLTSEGAEKMSINFEEADSNYLN